MRVVPLDSLHIKNWLAMRMALWPDYGEENLRTSLEAMLADDGLCNIVALDDHGAAIGFAEAALRGDYVNGCETSPVAFLEAIFVVPAHRKRGVARALTDAVEAWARSKGVREVASDALLENTTSHQMHKALGFNETERVVYFRKIL